MSFIAHITAIELTRLLSQTDAANGLANRFLWICVRRSKELPFGGKPPETIDLEHHLRKAAEHAKSVGCVLMDGPAKDLWRSTYHDLTTRVSPGLLGAVTSRSDPHVLRLALIYCLFDCRDTIGREHLEAALAVWRYAEQSAAFVFGQSLGDPDAEKLIAALKAAPEGLTKTMITNEVFGKHKPADRIDALLANLARACLIHAVTETTSGRSKTIWRANS